MLRHFAVLLSLSAAGSAAAHECDAILASGVRNTYQSLQRGDFRNNFSSTYCNELGWETGQTSGTSAGGGYATFSANINSNSSSKEAEYKKNCGSSAGGMSDDQYLSALKHVADRSIVEAWQQCIAAAYGVIATAETLSEGRLVILYRFRAAGNVTSATVSGAPSFDGLTCDGTIANGTVIDTGGLAQVCKRASEKQDAVVVLNTNFQPVTLTIPAVKEPVPVPEKPAHLTNEQAQKRAGGNRRSGEVIIPPPRGQY